MTTPEPRTRRCQGCGYRFRVSGTETYCSARCQAGAWHQVLDALHRPAGQGTDPR